MAKVRERKSVPRNNEAEAIINGLRLQADCDRATIDRLAKEIYALKAALKDQRTYGELTTAFIQGLLNWKSI